MRAKLGCAVLGPTSDVHYCFCHVATRCFLAECGARLQARRQAGSRQGQQTGKTLMSSTLVQLLLCCQTRRMMLTSANLSRDDTSHRPADSVIGGALRPAAWAASGSKHNSTAAAATQAPTRAAPSTAVSAVTGWGRAGCCCLCWCLMLLLLLLLAVERQVQLTCSLRAVWRAMLLWTKTIWSCGQKKRKIDNSQGNAKEKTWE